MSRKTAFQAMDISLNTFIIFAEIYYVLSKLMLCFYVLKNKAILYLVSKMTHFSTQILETRSPFVLAQNPPATCSESTHVCRNTIPDSDSGGEEMSCIGYIILISEIICTKCLRD